MPIEIDHDEAQRLMTSDPDSITSLDDHPAYLLAVPTPDHFIPLLYLAGVAADAETPATVLAKGYALGSLSMTAYRVD